MPHCDRCNKSFTREDHLRRHESSHSFPRFTCPHSGCGMRFHRQDVLRRHQTVHVPDPRKRRRRPRRGPLPRIGGEVAVDSPTGADQDVDSGESAPCPDSFGVGEPDGGLEHSSVAIGDFGCNDFTTLDPDSQQPPVDPFEAGTTGGSTSTPYSIDYWLAPQAADFELDLFSPFNDESTSQNLALYATNRDVVKEPTRPRGQMDNYIATIPSRGSLFGSSISQFGLPANQMPSQVCRSPSSSNWWLINFSRSQPWEATLHCEVASRHLWGGACPSFLCCAHKQLRQIPFPWS